MRGQDLLNAKRAQLAVIAALGQSASSYKHVPLVLDSEGRKLAKRSSDMGLEPLRSMGINSSKVVGLLASSLKLLPKGQELTADELVVELKNNPEALIKILEN